MPRALPVSPSLEHLKRQAKDLLKAYRAGNLEAQTRLAEVSRGGSTPVLLATAQLALAREYGFPSWARLKAHVGAARVAPEPRLSPRKRFVRDLADRLLGLARRGEIEALAGSLAIPLRDILDVRTRLIETGEHGALVDGLLAGLEHGKPRVRYDCAGALDHLADERCAPALRRLLEDPVPRVRRAALHSLSCDACKIAPLPAEGDLVARLVEAAEGDPSVRVRRAAVESLGAVCDDPRAVAALTALAERETDAGMLRRVRRALSRGSAPVEGPPGRREQPVRQPEGHP